MFLRIFKVLLVGISLETAVKGDGCTNYTVLSDATRSLSFYDSTRGKLCDKNLETKWYRFMGQAGNQMQEHCPTANSHQCQTFYAGWLNGKHPSALDGEVERKVCFRYHRVGRCCSMERPIKVKNCGDRYYIYKLTATDERDCIRYCGTRVGK